MSGGRPAVWAAVVPAAGLGRRMGFDKLLAPWHGSPVLAHTLLGLRRAGLTQLVVGVRDAAAVRTAVLEPFGLEGARLVPGGASRAETVARCLEALPAGVTHVLVHDAARPHCSVALIHAVMDAAEREGAAAAALPVVDTVHRADGQERIAETLDRSALRLAQTPQAFTLELLSRAHREGRSGSDDAGMVASLGVPVHLVPGAPENVKLTVPADLPAAGGEPMPWAVGLGHDVHRLVPGRPLILGGVRIPHELGLLGHSDADVLAHAVADAVLGAAGLGDIGRHFPPDDPAWEGADSLLLLRRCRGLAAAAGWRPAQVDCLVQAERPRLLPHAGAMADNIGGALGIAAGRVNVKAGTNEGMGFVGRHEGMAAQAVVLAARQGPV